MPGMPAVFTRARSRCWISVGSPIAFSRRTELPVLGAVPAPTAVLVRPDGYVAWVGDGSDRGLTEALTTWFGPPTAM
jgi:hypothetical protein